MRDLSTVPAEPLRLPAELTKPYAGKRYVSREPFLINPLVKDQRALEEIRTENINADRMFIGIPGFRALDILSVAGCEHDKTYRQAILFDNNEAQIKAMNGVLHLVSECQNAGQFREAFTKEYLRWVDHVPKRNFSENITQKLKTDKDHPLHSRLAEDNQYFSALGRAYIPESPEGIKTYFKMAQANPNSWLQPENYARIRELVSKGRIATATIDHTDTERFHILRKHLHDNHYKLGHAYLSTSVGIATSGHATYHGKPTGTQTAEHNDTLTAYDNISSLGDKDSQYLLSMPGLSQFVLNTMNAKEFQWTSKALSKNIGTAEFTNSIREIFADGKNTYSLIISKAVNAPFSGNWDQMPSQRRENDYMVIISSELPEYFSNKANAAIAKAMHRMEEEYHTIVNLCSISTNSAENKPSQYVFRIPAEVIDKKQATIQEIADSIKLALSPELPTRGR